jgi:putative transcriptional regulator
MYPIQIEANQSSRVGGWYPESSIQDPASVSPSITKIVKLLAEAVGVSRQSVNSIERNRYVPSLPLALKFSEVFARPTDDIFTLEEKR